MDYFHLISGVDYPCKDNATFDRFFETHRGESFMHFDSEEEVSQWRDTVYRYRIQTWNFVDVLPWIPVRIRGLIGRVCRSIFVRTWIPDVVAGWQWFSWHRTVAEYVMGYMDSHPEYLRRFKYTCCCDEIIFHTLLQHKLKDLNINPHNSLRFIEWHPKRAYTSLPLVLNLNEYDDIIGSDCLFCRKIDPVESGGLIDMLDKHNGN